MNYFYATPAILVSIGQELAQGLARPFRGEAVQVHFCIASKFSLPQFFHHLVL